jgi:hypothetical protein
MKHIPHYIFSVIMDHLIIQDSTSNMDFLLKGILYALNKFITYTLVQGRYQATL